MSNEPWSIEKGAQLLDGKRIPRMAFGTFGLEAGAQTKESVLFALEAGYRHLDCARMYANERSVGQALAESGIPRSEVFITSKVWNDRQKLGQVRQSCEETLDALGIDCLDLFLIHWPVSDRYRKSWETLQELKADGLTKSIGVANFELKHLRAIEADGSELPVVDQIENHPYFCDAELIAELERKGIVVESWSPFARGKCFGDPAISAIAQAHDIDEGQVINAWHLQHGFVTLPRSSKRQRIIDNLKAFELTLSADELSAIDALNKRERVLPECTPSTFEEFFEQIHYTDSPHD